MTGGPVNDEGFWDEESLDLEDGGGYLDIRIARGRAALEAGADGDEPETMASDTISNILTALYGPSGTYDENGDNYIPNDLRRAEAQRLLDGAMDSWDGDAEDYTRKADDEVDADGNLKGGLYSQEDAP